MAEYGEQSGASEAAYEESNAEERYAELVTKRENFLGEARACAELTIPSLIQPEDSSDGAELATCAQDTGARCVNGMANGIVLGNVPPNQPIMRFETAEIVEAVMDSQAPDEETKAAMDKSAREVRKNLDRVARETLKVTAVHGHRATFYEGSRHLVCGGNILYWALDDKKNYGKIRAIPLSRFVCLRDSTEFPIEIIVRDGLSAANLPPHLKKILNETKSPQEILREQSEVRTDSPMTDLAMFTYACWDPEKDKYKFHQCFRGRVVEGSQALYSIEDFPMLPLPFSLGDGESYGRGLVEESRGVLMALEALAQAETATSIALSEFRLLVGSGSKMRARDIMNTPTGQPLDAEPGSIEALSFGKSGDLAAIMASMAAKERLLGIKFGDNMAVQRNAERVTAEEFKTLTLAMERATGGVSAGISSRFLPWYARRLLLTLKHEQPYIEIPGDRKDDPVQIKLITGLDAIGRNYEAQQFIEAQQVLSELITPQVYGERVNVEPLADKINGYFGVETKGIYKTDEQIAQATAQEQQRQENLAAVGPIIDGYKQAALQQGQPQK